MQSAERQEREHDRFMGRLEGYLTTGEEDIGKSFSETIKDMYPDSSKKRIKGAGSKIESHDDLRV